MFSCFFVAVISQQFVHFKHLFVVKYQKFTFCGKCVVEMENSLGDRTKSGITSSSLKITE